MTSDAIILGAGGAGLMCAIQAARRGRRVVILDHAQKVGGKILISGGGRCNFTNTGASPENYVSQNPHFMKSALSRFSPDDFIALVRDHGIAFHEKKLGQLFCDGSAQAIVTLLEKECAKAGVQILLGVQIGLIQKLTAGYQVETSQGQFNAPALVVATGGLSIPKLGATDLGYRIAKQFGLKLVERAPALDGFVFSSDDQIRYRDLAGLSVDCEIECKGIRFRENILFTHGGLSGPAALQASLHWYKGDTVRINLLPDFRLFDWLKVEKQKGNRSQVKNLLAEKLPARLAERLCALDFPNTLPLPQVSEKELEAFCEKIHAWNFVPKETVGYSKAEVTRGGVDTDELSSKTMEAKRSPGLYFIGEVVDVTGWLGGYNFQWAWASGAAAGLAV